MTLHTATPARKPICLLPNMRFTTPKLPSFRAGRGDTELRRSVGRVSALQGEDSSSLVGSAVSQFGQGTHSQRLDAARAAVRTSPTCPQARIALGEAYLLLGEPDFAYQQLREARACLCHRNQRIQSITSCGRIEEERKQVDRLLERCEYFMRACSSEHSVDVALRSMCTEDSNSAAVSAALLSAILKKFPAHVGAIERLVALLGRWRPHDPEAVATRLDLCRQLTELQPSRAGPFATIAAIYHQVQLAREELGQPQGNLSGHVIDHASRALQRDPYNIEALRLMAQQLRYRGKYAAALQFCNKAFSLVLRSCRASFRQTQEPQGNADIFIGNLTAKNVLEAIGITCEQLAQLPIEKVAIVRKWIAFCFCDRASIFYSAAQDSSNSSLCGLAEQGLKDALSAVEVLPDFGAGLMIAALCYEVLGNLQEAARLLQASWKAEPTARVRREMVARKIDPDHL